MMDDKEPTTFMPALDSNRNQFVIGLAGHIDHGKSALVRFLTGGTVDRLPEEQRRQITIELGFSHFDVDARRFALIDVPGHERFIHTMVAGASGIDAALLVVAADDSVMPQTREHLAILELLGVQRGVIAISKCDLASDDLLELVELETAELVKGTFLEAAIRVRVSAHTGFGLDDLRQAIMSAALSSPPRNAADARFRLPVDRVFSPPGQGAVVTGTVWSGATRASETLQLLPGGTEVRIRQLQAQGQDVESVSAGERAALNLVGVKAAAIQRGDELVTPGAFQAGRRHLVQLRTLADARQPLKHRQLVRLHVGASQTTAQVLIEQRELSPGEATFAVLRTATPIVGEYGQPFVLRQLSPAATIGGGKFLVPALQPRDKFKQCLAAAAGLAADDYAARVQSLVELRREVNDFSLSQSQLGLTSAECETALKMLLSKKQLVASKGSPRSFVTARRFSQLKQRLLRTCREELERRRPAAQVSAQVVLAALARHASTGVMQLVIDELVATHEIIRRGDRIGLSSGAELSQRERQRLAMLLDVFLTAGRAPPTLKELAEQTKLPPRELEQLVQVAVDDGQLVKLSQLMAIDREALEGLRRSLATYFERQPTAKVGELREQWGITRKHAVPIFEYFDECGVTLRKDDLRTPGPRLLTPLGEAPA